jgi:hypothetical protein
MLRFFHNRGAPATAYPACQRRCGLRKIRLSRLAPARLTSQTASLSWYRGRHRHASLVELGVATRETSSRSLLELECRANHAAQDELGLARVRAHSRGKAPLLIGWGRSFYQRGMNRLRVLLRLVTDPRSGRARMPRFARRETIQTSLGARRARCQARASGSTAVRVGGSTPQAPLGADPYRAARARPVSLRQDTSANPRRPWCQARALADPPVGRSGDAVSACSPRSSSSS